MCEEDGNRCGKGNSKEGESNHYQNPKYFRGRVDSKARIVDVFNFLLLEDVDSGLDYSANKLLCDDFKQVT